MHSYLRRTAVAAALGLFIAAVLNWYGWLITAACYRWRASDDHPASSWFGPLHLWGGLVLWIVTGTVLWVFGSSAVKQLRVAVILSAAAVVGHLFLLPLVFKVVGGQAWEYGSMREGYDSGAIPIFAVVLFVSVLAAYFFCARAHKEPLDIVPSVAGALATVTVISLLFPIALMSIDPFVSSGIVLSRKQRFDDISSTRKFDEVPAYVVVVGAGTACAEVTRGRIEVAMTTRHLGEEWVAEPRLFQLSETDTAYSINPGTLPGDRSWIEFVRPLSEASENQDRTMQVFTSVYHLQVKGYSGWIAKPFGNKSKILPLPGHTSEDCVIHDNPSEDPETETVELPSRK
jgi:hypothetical protein